MKEKKADNAAGKCGAAGYKGPLVELFRSTPTNTVCPNFFVLHHAHGCMFSPMCSYCYLKSSFEESENPMQAFGDTPAIMDAVRAWIARDDLESFTLNTGNLSDSLAFEKARPLMGELVELFRAEAEKKGRPHTLLILTKGGLDECGALLSRPPCKNVVVSFSVNAPEAAAKLEAGAAPVAQRMKAARMLKNQGWGLRMRIDPMILGYDYGPLLSQMRDLAPERVTLGTLRAEPSLFSHVDGLFGELAPPETPKSLARYARKERMGLLKAAVDALRDTCSIGLCEETPDVWDELGLDRRGCTCNCNSDLPKSGRGKPSPVV